MSQLPMAGRTGLPDATGDSPDLKQRRRRRLVLFGAVPHAVNAVTLFAFGWLGWVAEWVSFAYLAYNLASTAIFHTLVASGWNLRFRDPTMGAAMILSANASGLVAIFLMNDMAARAVFSMLGLVAMAFAALSLSRARIQLTTAVTAQGFIVVFVSLWLLRGDGLNRAAEAMLLVAQLAALSQMAFFGGKMLVLRQQLEQHRRLLDRALHRLNDRNERLHRELGEVAARAALDELSGLHNRRHLMEVMGSEIARAARYRMPLSVALLDIDRFKRINDTWGHAAGDTVLRHFSRAVSRCMRSIDCLGRYGGEEFLVVMPGTTLNEARVLAERIRLHVAGTAFLGVPEGHRITISAGIAQWRSGEMAESTILRADHALYLAKGRGRNCVVSSGGSGRTLIRLPA